mgnify:CR=1 FL=1
MRKAHGFRGYSMLKKSLGAAVASLLIATTVSARDENPGQWYNDGQAELKRLRKENEK